MPTPRWVWALLGAMFWLALVLGLFTSAACSTAHPC